MLLGRSLKEQWAEQLRCWKTAQTWVKRWWKASQLVQARLQTRLSSRFWAKSDLLRRGLQKLESLAKTQSMCRFNLKAVLSANNRTIKTKRVKNRHRQTSHFRLKRFKRETMHLRRNQSCVWWVCWSKSSIVTTRPIWRRTGKNRLSLGWRAHSSKFSGVRMNMALSIVSWPRICEKASPDWCICADIQELARHLRWTRFYQSFAKMQQKAKQKSSSCTCTTLWPLLMFGRSLSAYCRRWQKRKPELLSNASADRPMMMKSSLFTLQRLWVAILSLGSKRTSLKKRSKNFKSDRKLTI